MVLVLRDAGNETWAEALQPLTQSEAATDLIRQKFYFTGFAMDSPLVEQLSNLVNLGESRAALYFVIV